MFAATSWLPSNSRARSSPPYGNARWLTATIAVLYAGVVTARRPMSGSNEYSAGGSVERARPRPASIARAALASTRAAPSRALATPCGTACTLKNSASAIPPSRSEVRA